MRVCLHDDYTVPTFGTNSAAAVEDESASTGPLQHILQNVSASTLEDVFTNLTFASSGPQEFQPKQRTQPTEDFTPGFLAHAQFYTIAEKYMIESLRKLVLHKLFKKMYTFKPHSTNVPGLMEFVKFIYEDTPSLDGEMDQLRKLTAHLVASVAGNIGSIADFQELLAEGGDFVVDFWTVLLAVDGRLRVRVVDDQIRGIIMLVINVRGTTCKHVQPVITTYLGIWGRIKLE